MKIFEFYPMKDYSQSSQEEKPQILKRKFSLNQSQLALKSQTQGQILEASSQKSPYSSAYSDFFSNQQLDSQKNRRMNIIDELCQQGNFRYQENDFTHLLQVKLLNVTAGYEIVHLQARIGYFTIPVVIYNSEGESSAHHMLHVSSTFASIYAVPGESNSIIKCFQIRHQDQLRLTIRSAIKQSCLIRLAAAMKAGPTASALFGFDLVLFDNCVELAMEQCEYFNQISKQEQNQLKMKLFDFHSISLIHMDIKPSNICFSPSLQQLVFIDFGLSEIISQPIGTMSSTRFAGTLNYCCSQMFKLYSRPSPYGLVDLYYNDICCLQKTIAQIQQKEEGWNGLEYYKDKDDLFQQQNIVYKRAISRLLEEFLIIETKCRLYRMDSINSLKYEECIHRNYSKFIKFIRRLPYSFFLQNILSQSLQFPNRQKVQIQTSYHYKRYSFESILWNQQESSFENRFSWLKNGELWISGQKRIKNAQNWRDIALKPQIAMKMPCQAYFQAYVKFVDLQVGASSWNEKKQASLCMIHLMKLSRASSTNSIQKGQQQTFSLLSTCFITIINEFLTNYHNQSAITLIPIVFHNIVILESLSYQQLRNLVERITCVSLNSVSLIKLLLRCSFAFDFIQAKCHSRYQNEKICQQVFGLILQKMKKIMQIQEKDNLIEIVVWLVQNDRNHETQLSVPSLLPIIQKFFSNSKDSFILELGLYYHSISLLRNNSSHPIHILNIIRVLQCLEQSQLNSQDRFQYYHFRVAKKVIEIGNCEMLKTIYKRLQACLQHPLLLSNYCLYYLNTCLDANSNPQRTAKYFYLILSRTPLQDLVYENEFYEGLKQILQISLSVPEMQKIYLILHEKLSIDFMLNIDFPENSYSSNILGFYLNYYYLAFVFFSLNTQRANIYEEMNQIFTKMYIHWQRILCQDCKEQSKVFLTLLQGFLLEAQGYFEKALHVYWNNDPLQSMRSVKYPLLLKIMRLATLHKEMQQKYSLMSQAYLEMERGDQIYYLLIAKEGSYAFEALCNHFFERSDIDRLVKLHLYLCEFLFHSSSIQLISNYAEYTAHFFSRHYISTSSLVQRYSDQFHRHGLQFSALFLSIALLNQQNQGQSNPVILLLCQLTLKLPIFTRRLVLSNLYRSLLNNIKRKIQKKQRLARYWFLGFLKNYHGYITARQFFQGIGFRKKQQLKNTRMSSALQKYAKNMFTKKKQKNKTWVSTNLHDI